MSHSAPHQFTKHSVKSTGLNSLTQLLLTWCCSSTWRRGRPNHAGVLAPTLHTTVLSTVTYHLYKAFVLRSPSPYGGGRSVGGSMRALCGGFGRGLQNINTPERHQHTGRRPHTAALTGQKCRLLQPCIGCSHAVLRLAVPVRGIGLLIGTRFQNPITLEEKKHQHLRGAPPIPLSHGPPLRHRGRIEHDAAGAG